MPGDRQAKRSRKFLLQRALEERRAAAQASGDEARLAHRTLARRYVGEAREARAGQHTPATDANRESEG